MESNSDYNATLTTFNNNGEELTTIWTILGIVIVLIWTFATITCIYHFRPSDGRVNSRYWQERKPKILHPEPEKRKKVIASVIVTKKVTKRNKDGKIEFSEQNNATLTKQESGTLDPSDKHFNTELRQPNITSPSAAEICNDEEMKTKIKEVKVTSISSDDSCDSFSEHSEKETDCEEQRPTNFANESKKNIEEHHIGDDADLGLSCSICLDDFDVGDELSWSRQLRCQHVFHSDCLASWLMKNDECPVCRTVLLEEEDFLACEEGSADSSISGTSSSAEELLDSSLGMYFVLNGMVSFVRTSSYNILENLQHNIDNSVCDESMSTSDRRKDNESTECVEVDTECEPKERHLRKGSRSTSRGKYNIIQSVGSDEEEGLSIS